MSMQKALLLREANTDLVVDSFPIPPLNAGHILVEVRAAGLNPVDFYRQKMGMLVSSYPAVLGVDSAGVVVAVGEGVTSFAEGDRVSHPGAFTNDRATFQQHTSVPVEYATKLPDHITFDEAASIPLTISTAAVGLYQKKTESTDGLGLIPPWNEGGQGAYAGKALLVLGGSTSVGQFVIQFAKMSGFSPIITTTSPQHAEYLKSLGATHVIDREADVLAEASIITKNVEYSFCCVGAKNVEKLAWEAVSEFGKVVFVMPTTTPDTDRYPSKSYARIPGTTSVPGNRPLCTGLYSKLAGLLERGEIKPNRVEVLSGGLSGIYAGLVRIVTGKVSGVKLVVRPHETE